MNKLRVTRFNKYLDQYLDERERLLDHQPSGVDANRYDLKLFSMFLHEKRYRFISGEVILHFIVYLRNKRKNGAGATNRKISSIRSYIKFLRFWQVEGAEELPVEYLGRVREPYAGPIEALDLKEVEKMLNCIDRESILGYRDYLLYMLLYRLGLCLGEALAINLDDIDLKKSLLRIHGKGRRNRALPLISNIQDIIVVWLDLRLYLKNSEKEDALFISKKGSRLAASTAQDNCKKIVNQVGPLSLKKVTPHSLRHAFATHAVEGNAELIVLKAVIGHASIHSTKLYIHPSIDVMRKAINNHIASDILNDIIAEGLFILRTHQCFKRQHDVLLHDALLIIIFYKTAYLKFHGLFYAGILLEVY